MNKLHTLLLVPVIFFGMLFLYTQLGGTIPVTSVVTQKNDAFTVTGTGEVETTPDQVSVSVGVQTTGSTVSQVQTDLNTRSKAVVDAIKAVGIDQKDIQTTNYSIYPEYDYETGRQRVRGYTASTNVTVTTKQIDQINAVIDAATANGANTVGNIAFDVADKTAAQNAAREKAMAEANGKAREAARVAGFSLGKIINYQESFSGEQPPYPMMARFDTAMSQEAKTDIQPGQQNLTVTVSVSYEIR